MHRVLTLITFSVLIYMGFYALYQEFQIKDLQEQLNFCKGK